MNSAQQPLNALPQGHRLQEYELVRVLGFGGFGMTYLGFDHNLNKAVAIKEYLPSDIATRTGNNSVAPQASQFQDDFEWGLERFLDEARTLARFDHRNIIKVYRFFEAHGTAYIVMEYAEGETLSAFIERKGTLKEAELRAILYPILDGLEVVHGADFLHRDIKPDNIIIRGEDSSPVLLDFGSARQAMGARSRSVTSIITPGYAPIEQYSSRGDQGPWTDIYALGGVCYSALTGEVPDDATDRVRNDPLIPVADLCAGQASAGFLSAIDWALAVDEGDRPQSIGVWRTALREETPRNVSAQLSVTASVTASPLEEEKREIVDSIAGRQPDASLSKKHTHTRGKLLAVVIISVVAVLIVGMIYINQAEKQRQELAVLEKQRQELAAEKARLTAEQAEKARREQAALEKQRQELAAEKARLAAEQAEMQRQEQAALEKRRQELAAEKARLAGKKARLAAEQAEKARREQAAEKTRRLAKWRDPRTGRTLLHDAAYKNAPETAEVLLKHGADPNATDNVANTPLHKAMISNAPETAEVLLKYGADPNATDVYGYTLLSGVVIANDYKMTEILLKHGADPNAIGDSGDMNFKTRRTRAIERAKTPLHTAAYSNASETAEVLLKHGADPNARDNFGSTPLHTAARENDHEIAKVLLKHGADPNAKDDSGHTPLYKAVEKHAYETAEVLLKYGADPNARDNFGNTPLRRAMHLSVKMAEMLRRTVK